MHEGSLLKNYLKRKKIQVKDLADQIDMSRQNMYIVFGKEVIPHQQKMLILKMLKSSEREVFSMSSDVLHKDHSPNYRQIDENNSLSLPVNQHGERKNMTIVPLKAVGGFLMGFKDKVYLDSLEQSSFPLIKGRCFRFEVEGYSMMPVYPPQSHVVCTQVEKAEYMQKNKDYVIATNDDLPLKRFSKIENGKCHVYSLNKEYDGIKPIPLKDVQGIYLVELQIINPYR